MTTPTLIEVRRQRYLAALANPRMQAFLAVIRAGEGTSDEGGYYRKFGGEMIKSLDKHPRTPVTKGMGAKVYTSTAAGAYQFLTRTWDECANALMLTDFSKASQDMAAVFLIDRRKALAAVLNGEIQDAIKLCNREWASLPGSPYGQPTKTMAQALETYTKNLFEDKPAPVVVPAVPVTQESRTIMPIPAILATLLPILTGAVPELIKLIKPGSESAAHNAEITTKVFQVAQEALGAVNAQEVVEQVQADPKAAQLVRTAVQTQWFDLVQMAERFNAMEQANISAARVYNTSEPMMIDVPWLKLRFIHVLSLVLVSFSGWFVTMNWEGLTPELKGAVITLMIIAGWNGVKDYWMGSSSGSDRKTMAMIDDRKATV